MRLLFQSCQTPWCIRSRIDRQVESAGGRGCKVCILIHVLMIKVHAMRLIQSVAFIRNIVEIFFSIMNFNFPMKILIESLQ
jgi:hypothetical protein